MGVFLPKTRAESVGFWKKERMALVRSSISKVETLDVNSFVIKLF